MTSAAMKHYDRLHDLRKPDKLTWLLTPRNYKKKQGNKRQRGFSRDWRLSWNRRNHSTIKLATPLSVASTWGNALRATAAVCRVSISLFVSTRQSTYTAKSRVVEAGLKLPGAELSPYFPHARSLSLNLAPTASSVSRLFCCYLLPASFSRSLSFSSTLTFSSP